MRLPFSLVALFALCGVSLGAILVAQTPPAPLYALAATSQANHSAASFLTSSSALTGSVYVFTSPASTLSASPAGINHVCYWLDKAVTTPATHCEFATSYDLIGTVTCPAGGLCGTPWDTRPLADGWHTLAQIVTPLAGAAETDSVTFRTYNGTAIAVNATYDDGSAVAGNLVLQTLGAGGVVVSTTTNPLPLTNFRLVIQADTIYSASIQTADGTVLVTAPFAALSILKVDPAAIRAVTFTAKFRKSDNALLAATPAVSFAF